MTVGGVLLINSDWANLYPWAMPGLMCNTFIESIMPVKEMMVGIIGGGVVARWVAGR